MVSWRKSKRRGEEPVNPMKMSDLQEEWAHARCLTWDLLNVCTAEDLGFAPGPDGGSLWKQFRHVGRVHGDYLDGVRTGVMRFDSALGGYDGGASRDALCAYFDGLERRHRDTFAGPELSSHIDWFGDAVARDIHLVRLISHETLHHGQLILYWHALGRDFPKSWESWGLG